MITAPVLEAKNVEMTLGRAPACVQALKGVCISIVAGQLTLLMGPSGSGKSTLLSILGCILKQTKGSVRIGGTLTDTMDSEQLAALRRQHIGFVFQSFNLFPGLSALENVKTSLAIRAHNAANGAGAAREALESVGLGHCLHSLPGQMSGGEQQRVAIARAIVSKPSIILADEPTASLDAASGRNVMEQLQRHARGADCAVLVVSHDARAMPFADRVIAMEDGRILTDSGNKTASASRGQLAYA